MDLKSELREMQQRITNLNAKKTRAEIEQDNARARALEAKNILETEYGITDQSGMSAKLAELQAELDQTLVTVRSKLEESGA